MDRRGILKSLIAAPIAAITFNKTSKAKEWYGSEKITFNHIDLDQELPELEYTGIAGSGTFPRCSG